MKTAVASDDGKTITGHIGRCKMFIIFTTEDREILNKEIRENTFTRHRAGRQHLQHQHQGEQGPHKHQGVINGLKDCNHLICCGAGHGLVTDLRENNIDVILTDETDAEKAVKMFLEGKLKSNSDLKCNGHNG